MPSSPESDAQEPDGATAVADLREERDRLEDRLKRALADLDNYRKRSMRELDRRVEGARDTLVREWLEALDSVERAISAGAADALRPVLEQMEAILARHGIRRSAVPGEPFDPELHEAVGVVERDDVPDRAIVEVVRAGFVTDDGRVVRPALVMVARPPAPAAAGDG